MHNAEHRQINRERLKILDLPSMQHRRYWGDMIELFKLFSEKKQKKINQKPPVHHA